MEGYVKLRKTLSSKSKKSKTPSKSFSPPPRSTAPDVDIDSKLAAQLVTKSIGGPKVRIYVRNSNI